MSSTAEVEKRAFKKVAVRLLPLLTFADVLNYLDRNNPSPSSFLCCSNKEVPSMQFA